VRDLRSRGRLRASISSAIRTRWRRSLHTDLTPDTVDKLHMQQIPNAHEKVYLRPSSTLGAWREDMRGELGGSRQQPGTEPTS